MEMDVIDQVSDGTLEAGCPLCGEDHSELAGLLAEADFKRTPNKELIAESEYLQYQLAELLEDGPPNKELESFYLHRMVVVRDEIERRVRLAKHGGPPVPNQGLFPPEVINEIKSRIEIVSFLGRDIPVYHTGQRWKGGCPVHGDGTDKDPSLVIYPDEGKWWCFGCNSGGDCFAWLMVYHGFTFRESIEQLARETGVRLPSTQHEREGPRGFEI